MTGEDVWKRLREYCLLQTTQRFRVTAVLPEFPLPVMRAIELHERWNELCGSQGWTVFIRVKGGQFGRQHIRRFLEQDGKARKRPWDVMQLHFDAMAGNDQPIHEGGKPPSNKIRDWDLGKVSQNFGIKFSTEKEAMIFWRTWHRRPCRLLAEDKSTPDANAPFLHVELTW